jgi:hypothetical protein
MESDYRKTFKGISQRANVRWAEVNPWAEEVKTQGVSSEELEQWAKDGSTSVTAWSTQGNFYATDRLATADKADFLKDHLSRHSVQASSSRRPSGLKTAPIHKSVSEVWATYLESDDPRKVIRQLKSRDKFPFKTLAFDQQDRPPYRGTWTKSSAVVGPRTPFAQDPIFDYSYDSADEWVEDEGGEGVDDPDDAADEEDEEEEGTEAGEFDDWLDDSEDAQFAPDAMDMDEPEQTKLPLKVVKKMKPRKKIVKLTPTWDGPLWEDTIGRGTGGFEEYRIQLLNGEQVGCALNHLALTYQILLHQSTRSHTSAVSRHKLSRRPTASRRWA